jgi:hypothetical protein
MSVEETFVQYEGTNAEFNALGEHRNIHTLDPLSWRHADDSGRVRVLIKNSVGEILSLDLRRIIAELFVPREEHEKDYVPSLKDSNPFNVAASNIVWRSRSDVYFEWRDAYMRSVIDRFQIPPVNPDENAWADLKECPFKPGYYYLPFVQTYLVVNREGDVFNLVKNRSQHLSKDKKGYFTISVPWGAEQINALGNYRYHRLLALVFHRKPDDLKEKSFDELHVNHIDADNSNNTVDNLEWTTHKGNLDHARALGLFSSEIPVLEKDVKTGAIVRFQSLSSLSRYSGIAMTALKANLDDGWFSVVPVDGKVYKYDDESDWPAVAAEGTYLIDRHRYRRFVVRDVSTGVPYFFNTVIGCCEHLKLPVTPFKLHMHRKGRAAPFRGYVVEEFAKGA